MSVRALPLGAAVIGLGVGEQHAKAFAASDRCRLLRLCDHDPERARDVARRLGVPAALSSLEEILGDPAVHAVSIASFDQDHAAQAAACLKAGKHVFVEKPLCRSLDELKALQGAWERGGRPVLASNLVLRAAPLYRWLKGAIERGELGEVYAFDADYLYGRFAKITDGWRRDVPDYSVLMGGGIHVVDLMLWLTGQRPSHVATVGSRLCSRGTAFRYDDFAAATFRFPSGLVGRVTANFGCVHPHHHVLRAFGTKATFLYDDQGPRWLASREPGARPRPVAQAPLPASKGDLIPDFIDAVTGGRDAAAGARREFDTVAACLAADTALKRAESISVEYP